MKTNIRSLVLGRRSHLVFPCVVFAAAVSVGTAGIATAEQCLVPAIAFTSNLDGGALEIYLKKMNEDGTDDPTVEIVRVTNNTDADGFPSSSPDGKKIVFDSNRARLVTEPINTSDLFVMNTDGTEQTHLIRGSTASWSPDGKYIAFHRSASGTGLPIKPDPGAATFDSDIFIMNVDDLSRINITNSMLYIEDDPDWSPDGKKIVFTRHDVNDNHNNSTTAEICVLDLETAELQCHLTTNNQEERAPAWSPDGAKIAYMCRRNGPDFEICVMNSDGTENLQPLTNNTVLDASPKWSPDGQKILFHRLVAAGQQQLFVMNADGSDQKQLTDFAGTNLLAAWGKIRANCDNFWPPVPTPPVE